MKIIKENDTYQIIEKEKVILTSKDAKEVTNSFLFLLDYPSVKEKLTTDPISKEHMNGRMKSLLRQSALSNFSSGV